MKQLEISDFVGVFLGLGTNVMALYPFPDFMFLVPGPVNRKLMSMHKVSEIC